MSRPRLTVAIPAYNQPEFLRETMESLCDQGLHRDDYVVAVSDDGSTKPLEEVVLAFSDRLQVVYDRSPINIGHLKNWDRASHLTDTPYLSFLSHDDVVFPGHFGRVLSLLESRADAVLASSLVLCQSHPGALNTYMHGLFLRGQKASFTAPYEWDATEWMALTLVGTPLSVIGSVFQTDAFRKCSEWHRYPVWHDRLMLGEMGLHGAVVSLPWIAGYYRVGEGQLSRKLWHDNPDEFRTVSSLVLEMSRRKGIRVTEFWIDLLCAADPEARIAYLFMLHRALGAPEYEAIKAGAEQRLHIRLHLGGRLDRLGVPKPIANLIRAFDRAVIRREDYP